MMAVLGWEWAPFWAIIAFLLFWHFKGRKPSSSSSAAPDRRPAPAIEIEINFDFSKFHEPDFTDRKATERQIDHLKRNYGLDIPPEMPIWTASNLIFTLKYIQAVYMRLQGHRYNGMDAQALLKTLSWILSDNDMVRHIKRLNKRRFYSGNDLESSNLPTTSQYYKRLENFMASLSEIKSQQ